ncbi:hypothetical protein SYNTR_1212 [Candidatus Syntrophocurvum alkaliphilum]|uniref:Uncharacterized protein n=2 Tax=Candidatus Syntrophocurvum alkaliphilum TaxID=2293317 RepID=A0A6I6DAS2_9FIRM|nr:hypothetical protein SYNTR_1212 [Candidatus Syntrophocurvum alkaliphilum]
MPVEKFKLEKELIRFLYLFRGGFNRKQLADRLGISIDMVDKAMYQISDAKKMDEEIAIDIRNREVFKGIYNDYYKNSPVFVLSQLFCLKSIKEKEKSRYEEIIKILNHEKLTLNNILDLLSEKDEIDEKTLRRYIKYLIDLKVISTSKNNRRLVYSLNNDLIDNLSEDEIVHLCDYIYFCIHYLPFSVLGYMLLNNLDSYLSNKHSIKYSPVALHRYFMLSRILDEDCSHILSQAISERKNTIVSYFPSHMPIAYCSSSSNQNNRKYKKYNLYPLKLIFDCSYGRWYLLAQNKSTGEMQRLRLDRIHDIEIGENTIDESEFLSLQNTIDNDLTNSWILETGLNCEIHIRFYHDDIKGNNNFLKERVITQGRWGEIYNENEGYFDYKITVNGFREIKPWIRSFGHRAEVIAPSKLRQEIKEEFKEMIYLLNN